MSNLNNIPVSQEFDAHELESKGIRELFKLQLRDDSNTVLFVNNFNEVTYAGQTWEYWPCKMTENSQDSSGEMSRPKISFANPNGAFSLWIGQGVTEGAVLTRYRVLLTDLEADVRSYHKNVWTLSRPVNLSKNLVTFECRSMLDGHNFQLPARSFYPPEFPHVTLR